MPQFLVRVPLLVPTSWTVSFKPRLGSAWHIFVFSKITSTAQIETYIIWGYGLRIVGLALMAYEGLSRLFPGWALLWRPLQTNTFWCLRYRIQYFLFSAEVTHRLLWDSLPEDSICFCKHVNMPAMPRIVVLKSDKVYSPSTALPSPYTDLWNVLLYYANISDKYSNQAGMHTYSFVSIFFLLWLLLLASGKHVSSPPSFFLTAQVFFFVRWPGLLSLSFFIYCGLECSFNLFGDSILEHHSDNAMISNL